VTGALLPATGVATHAGVLALVVVLVVAIAATL